MSLTIVSEQQQARCEQKLQKWKKLYREKAQFESQEGFPFNAFDAIWTLNGLGTEGQSPSFEFFYTKDWNDKLQCDIRLAIAKIATNRTVGWINQIRSTLNIITITTFSKEEIEHYWPVLLEHQKKTLRSLLAELKNTDKSTYSDACDWVEKNYVQANLKSDPYDIEKGALSEFEMQFFERELAKAMKEKLIDLGKNVDDLAYQSRQLTTVKPFIMLRLLYALVRRPCNLNQAKWSDILPVGASFKDEKNQVQEDMDMLDFSDENELQMRICKSKNKSRFRQSIERYSLRLNAKLTHEVLCYRQAYRRCLQFSLEESNIQVTKEELDVLMMRSPVAYTPGFFEKKFKDKTEVFKALSENGSGFHDTNNGIQRGITRAISTLGLKSDRVPNMITGNNRIRHTVGKAAAITGADITEIASLLGNTPTAARIYIDMNDEQRANTDNQFIGNTKLTEIFNADIATLQKQTKYTMSDSNGNVAGQAKKLQSCSSCDEIKRPLACYGCNNFQALEDGDHRNIRDEAQRLYDKRIADGEPSYLLGKLVTQIKWVSATIEVCEEKVANRSALNA